MKHSIIRDFSGWNLIMEAGEPVPAPAAAAPVAAAPAAAAPAAAAPAAAAVKLPTTPIKSADGALTSADLLIIQQVISAILPMPTLAADGKLGPGTIGAIDAFRKAQKIEGDPAVTIDKIKGVTVGPKTLAKVNELITNPPKPAEPAPAAPAAAAAPAAEAPAAAAEAPAAAAAPAAPAAPNAEPIIELITAQFGDAAFWKPFKGRGGIFGNDDEKAAVEGFTAWFNTTIKPMVDKLPATDPNKAAFVSLLATLTSAISRKLNKVPITYTDKDGKPASATVNADF